MTGFKQKVEGVKQKQVLGIQILEKGGREFILRQTTRKQRYRIAITKRLDNNQLLISLTQLFNI